METTALDLDPSEIQISVKRGGKEETLCLREMSAALRDKYLDSMAARVRLGPDGTAQGIKAFDGMQADLLERCLFRGDKKIEREEIQRWPAGTVNKLFLKAQELNHLGKGVEKAAEAAKND